MKNKKLQVLFKILIGILIIALFSTVLKLNDDFKFDLIMTFLSITTGFCITAFSIIANSSFSKYLYSIEDEKNNSKTLLHDLVYKFKSAIFLFLTTIALIFFLSCLGSWNISFFQFCQYPISFQGIIKAIILYLIILSFYQFVVLVRIFAKFVIQSGIK